MKKLNIALTVFTLLIPNILIAQDINVHYLIGKSKVEVIKKYGNPVHQDNSNPAMVCMFYQGSGFNMVFVGNKEGIYQAEARFSYNSESTAEKALNKFVKNSISKKFIVDTVSANAFKVHKTGVNADIQLYKNEINKNYEVSIKAGRSAG